MDEKGGNGGGGKHDGRQKMNTKRNPRRGISDINVMLNRPNEIMNNNDNNNNNNNDNNDNNNGVVRVSFLELRPTFRQRFSLQPSSSKSSFTGRRGGGVTSSSSSLKNEPWKKTSYVSLSSSSSSSLRRNNGSSVFVIGIVFLASFIFLGLIERALKEWEQSIQKNVISNEHGGIGGRKDYANFISSIQDISAEFVSRRCHQSIVDDTSCTCADPSIGSPRHGQRHWLKAVHENIEFAKHVEGNVDIVFYGDSIIEGWRGTSYGFDKGSKADNVAIFNKYFGDDDNKENRNGFRGLVLGLSGDTSPNLLWRLQNGELPTTLNPHVFWILIGTNDFGNTWCSAEMVLLGILRIAEEIRLRKPGSIVVLNGIIPRTFDREGGRLIAMGKPKKPSAAKGYMWHGGAPGAGAGAGGENSNTISSKPSLWRDIVHVNEQLRSYAERRDGIEYVDSSHIFLTDANVTEDKLTIDPSLMPDYLHPSAYGYELWAQSIVTKLEELLLQQQ